MIAQRFLPVSAPSLIGNEKAYVLDCLETTWISAHGKYVDQFESRFAEFCGASFAVSCCNGTAALHLALLALGIGAGDEVIVPTLTYIATVNAVTYTGAVPVFVDSEPETWNLDPAAIESKITKRTRAIMVVDLYGHPVDLDPIRSLAKRYRLKVIDDAAEAHGAEYKGRPLGSLADITTFSFFGNKVITTGEGGMVVTDDPDLAKRVRLFGGQGMDPERRYWFPIVGYNYRMTNLAAAIGLAQLEQAAWHLARRQEVAAWYREQLDGAAGLRLHQQQPWAKHAYWMVTAVVDEGLAPARDAIMAALRERGVETRPVFYPAHILPPYRHLAPPGGLPVAESIAARGINLPTWAGLTREDVRYVCRALRECVEAAV